MSLTFAGKTPDEVADAIREDMTPEDQKKIGRALLPTAPKGIWYLLLTGLLVLACVFGILAFVLIRDGKGAEALVALATASVGAVAGLLAPSPLSS